MHIPRAAILAALLTAPTFAQPATAPPVAVAQVRVQNITNHARQDVITTVLPFADAADYQGEPLVLIDGPHKGRELQIDPSFGARWPDGSWRFARVHIPTQLAARESAIRSIGVGSGARTGFRWASAIRNGAARMMLGLQAAANVGVFGPWHAIETGHLVNEFRARGRIPNTTMWYEAHLRFGDNQSHAKLWVQYGDSDPRDKNVTHSPGPIDFLVQGPTVRLRHEWDKVFSRGTDPPDGTTLRLEQGTRWADGESQAFKAVLLFRGGDTATFTAESQWPVFAVSTSWADSGAFGPWGYLPPLPPGQTPKTALQRAISEWNQHSTGRTAKPWAAPVLGLGTIPGGTGDQKDFSAAVMIVEANGIAIERLHVVERSALRDACRPTHIRNVDASPVKIGADPSIMLWHGRPDHRFTVNKLGKSRGLSQSDTHRSSTGENWWGRDREHWSCNYLAYWTLLTGDRFGIVECNHLIELWLGELRQETGGPYFHKVLSGMGPARDVGRTLQAAANLYLVTGRTDLANRVRARIGIVERQWRGRNTSPVRPGTTYPPDGRNLGGLFSYWMPWQQALGVVGLEGAALVFSDNRSHVLGEAWAANFLDYGVFRPGAKYRASKATEWRPGGVWPGWQQFGAGAGPGAAPLNLGDVGPPQFDEPPALTLEQYEAIADGTSNDPTLMLDAGPGAAGPINVEFYDAYLLWMSPGCVLAQTRRYSYPDPDKARACAAQVGNDWRAWEWKAVR